MRSARPLFMIRPDRPRLGWQPAAAGVEKAVRKLISFPFFPLQVARGLISDFHAGDVINPRLGVTL